MNSVNEKKVLLNLLLVLQLNILSLYLLWKLEKSKRWLNRKRLVRPINSRRPVLGHFITLYNELRADPVMFFNYTRMSVETFDYLLYLLTPYIMKKHTNINAAQSLLITLRYLATGDSINTIALNYRIGVSTCQTVIKQVSEKIFKVLSPIYLRVPTEEDWKSVSRGFLHEWNLPNCCGAIDGKRIEIIGPANSGSLYSDNKKTFSIMLLAVCSHAYEFTLVDVGAVGSESDGGIFVRSELGRAMRQKNLNFPDTREKLPGTNISFPHYFVGDEAFAISSNLLTPYPGCHLEEKKLIFNYRLSRASRVIENTFGIWASRWKFLSKPIPFQPSVINTCVLASICLHNFLMKSNDQRKRLYCPSGFVDDHDFELIQNGGWRSEIQENSIFNKVQNINLDQEVLNAHDMRDTLSNYFLTPEGEVPWQWENMCEEDCIATINDN